jgi:uncharacterized membrane protein SpoIIM required for sporulation
VIIDLERFVATEKPFWDELERILGKLEKDPGFTLDIQGVTRLHYLYQRASAGLARVDSFAAAPEFRTYLEAIVSRAFAEIHETRSKPHRLAPLKWLANSFPQTFRRQIGKFQLAVLVTIAGAIFGAAALLVMPEEKGMLLPFGHLHGSPTERVAKEEKGVNRQLDQHKVSFSSQLMTHNTQVSISCMASGLTYGIGTLILLFYNGVILGAVIFDYLMAGQGIFLAGWLLPHGVIEIPAILIAAQAGFVMAEALIDRSSGLPIVSRMRQVWSDIVTLIGGVALMLVWAGLVEALFSQYHEPVLPYWIKISFGVTELVLLVVFLSRSGRKAAQESEHV